MELYQLKYFAKAARYENISMAAQELHVSQPSISKAIKALEGELQVELMRKEGKHSILTHEGRLLQARIAPIIEELDALPGEIKNRESRKIIRLNALSAALLLPELIREFQEKNPGIYFNLMEKREVVSWDICIRSTLPQVYFNRAVKLMEERLMLAFHKDSWLREKKVIMLQDLKNENSIELIPGGSIRMISDRKFNELGFIPKQAFLCENYYIVKRMVQEGLGVAIWPEYSWRTKLLETADCPEVCLRPLAIPGFTRSLYMLYSKDLKITPEIKKFADFTKSYFDQINQRTTENSGKYSRKE